MERIAAERGRAAGEVEDEAARGIALAGGGEGEAGGALLDGTQHGRWRDGWLPAPGDQHGPFRSGGGQELAGLDRIGAGVEDHVRIAGAAGERQAGEAEGCCPEGGANALGALHRGVDPQSATA